jgi:hypothetical protein
MGKTRDKFEPWLRDYLRPRYPELEPALLRAIDAFDTIRRSRRITPQLLAAIVEAASSSRRPLFVHATTFLGKLTRRFKEVRDAVESMAKDKRNHVRFNAILCLDDSTPRPFTVQLLRQGLRDRSANVRMKAADWSGRLRVREIVPDLEMALARETHAEARATLEFKLKLLRDGYILEADKDGFFVTTFTKDGIGMGWFSRSTLKERGIDAIVADIAK